VNGRSIVVVKKSGHALGALIDAVQEANGWSDPDVAARARARGHNLSKSNISRIRTDPVTSLNVRQMRALADGLEMPTAQLVQAALTAMGLSASEISTSVEQALRADPELSQRDRQLVLALLAAMRQPTSEETTEDERDATTLAELR
jgi:hypothetical protein